MGQKKGRTAAVAGFLVGLAAIIAGSLMIMSALAGCHAQNDPGDGSDRGADVRDEAASNAEAEPPEGTGPTPDLQAWRDHRIIAHALGTINGRQGVYQPQGSPGGEL